MLYYRQKILLALIEVSGKKVASTDLEKLLFLFCQETKQNHYSFFPYHYGAFSFMSYYDKNKLVEKGYLKDVSHFEMSTQESFLRKLKTNDRIDLQNFAQRTDKLRGRQLIRETYLNFPEYAIKSRIAKNILSKEEQRLIQSQSTQDSSTGLYTIGYEGKTIDEYLRELIVNDIDLLVDVRRNPLSRKHGFSKKRLSNYLDKVGIDYQHMSELGIASHLRRDLNNKDDYKNLFEHYSRTTLPKQLSALQRIENLVSGDQKVALTCFEADHQMCHRHKITEALFTKPNFHTPIIHL